MIRAALFDLDGLLVDTETLGIEVAIRVCFKLGIELTPAEKQSFIGVTDKKFYEKLFERRGLTSLSASVDTILRQHFDEYEARLREGVIAFPGASSLPKMLHENGIRLALVSGSTREQIDIILNQLGIHDLFEVIVSADDITESKPDPQGYLLAIKHLGVEPRECIVFEDAQTGVQAGKRAGARVIAIINKGDQEMQDLVDAGADIIKQNLNSVSPDLIKKWIGD